MSNKTPHPQAELLTAIAEGKELQLFTSAGQWIDCDGKTALAYVNMYVNAYAVKLSVRIKPEVKPDRECLMVVQLNEGCLYPSMRRPEHYEHHNLHLVFDGETGGLKSAEVV